MKFADAVGMVEYSAALNAFLKTLFPPAVIKMGLGETIVARRAEAAAHRRDREVRPRHLLLQRRRGAQFDGEERILVPSPKVATYDLKPEMSAPEVTDKLVEAIGSGKFDLIVVNFANTDMVGHTGDLARRREGGRGGRCLPRPADGGGRGRPAASMLVTADHGNAEQMYDETTHQKHTQHTLNRVPALLFNAPADVRSLADGKLADVRPPCWP